jgi:hypothetical protein
MLITLIGYLNPAEQRILKCSVILPPTTTIYFANPTKLLKHECRSPKQISALLYPIFNKSLPSYDEYHCNPMQSHDPITPNYQFFCPTPPHFKIFYKNSWRKDPCLRYSLLGVPSRHIFEIFALVESCSSCSSCPTLGKCK